MGIEKGRGRRFRWSRLLRLVGVVLAVCWLVVLHVGLINQAPFRIPVETKLAISLHGTIAIITMLVCLRVPWRYAFGVPYAMVAIWSLAGIWRY